MFPDFLGSERSPAKMKKVATPDKLPADRDQSNLGVPFCHVQTSMKPFQELKLFDKLCMLCSLAVL